MVLEEMTIQYPDCIEGVVEEVCSVACGVVEEADTMDPCTPRPLITQATCQAP